MVPAAPNSQQVDVRVLLTTSVNVLRDSLGAVFMLWQRDWRNVSSTSRAKEPKKGSLRLKMFMAGRFSTLIYKGLHVVKDSDHKHLITVLEKGLEDISSYISRLLLILYRNMKIVCSCMHTHISHVHTHAKYCLQLKVHLT